MKRYKVNLYAKGFSYQFEVDVPEGNNRLYNTDNTSMEFIAVDGRIIIVPRLEACIEMTPLVSETIWKEK
jgi:hypothetical protein